MEVFKKASRGNNLFWQIQTSNRILRGGEQTSVGKCTHLACNCFCFKNIKYTHDVLSAIVFCFQIQNGQGTMLEDFSHFEEGDTVKLMLKRELSG